MMRCTRAACEGDKALQKCMLATLRQPTPASLPSALASCSGYVWILSIPCCISCCARLRLLCGISCCACWLLFFAGLCCRDRFWVSLNGCCISWGLCSWG